MYKYTIPAINALVTPLPTLRRPQLIHLRNPLLELLVLAFLIAVSLCLPIYQPLLNPNPDPFPPDPYPSSKSVIGNGAYLTLPRQIILLVPTPVQRDKQVRTAIAVGDRKAAFGHGFSCRCYKYTSWISN